MNKYVKIMLKVSISALLILLLLQKIELREVGYIFANIKISYIIAILIIMIINLFITYISIFILLCTQIDVPPSKYIHSYLLSLSLGNLSPARVGDFSLAFFIKNELELSKSIAVIFLNKIITIVLMLLLTVVGVILIFPIREAILFVLVSGCALLIILLILKYSKTVLLKIIPLKKQAYFKDFYSTLNNIRYNHKRALVASFLIMFLKICMDSAIAYLLLNSLNVNASFGFIMFINAISVLTSLFPLTLNGLGLRETAVAYMFKYNNLNPAAGAAVFFALVIAYYVIVALIPIVLIKEQVERAYKPE